MEGRETAWSIDFYSRENGRKPAGEFVAALEKSRVREYRKVLSKFKLFETMGLQAAMDVKIVAPLRGYNGLYELRIKGTGFRFYGFLWHDPSGERRFFLVASAEEKEGREAGEARIAEAAAAREDWYRRFGKEGGGR